MCLILFAYKVHPAYPLVLAANRDESYARATAPATFWRDSPHVYGGRDLEQGGTWLGVSRDGALAAVTNFRSGDSAKSSPRSRGELAANFLHEQPRPAEYCARVLANADVYNGFNLLAGDLEDLRYVSNRGGTSITLAPGVHGLSNHLLNTPWPKVERGRKLLADALRYDAQEMTVKLFDLLAERTIAPDEALPATGIGLPRERVLSPAFIVTPDYGTRASTVILIDQHGQVIFIERSFGASGTPGPTTTGRFTLETAPARA